MKKETNTDFSDINNILPHESLFIKNASESAQKARAYQNIQNKFDANRSMEAQTWKNGQAELNRKAAEQLAKDRREYKDRLTIMAYIFGIGVIVGIFLSAMVIK
jgi:hypothetical protein